MTRLSLILVSTAIAGYISFAPQQEPGTPFAPVPAKTRSLAASPQRPGEPCVTMRHGQELSGRAACRSLPGGSKGPRG